MLDRAERGSWTLLLLHPKLRMAEVPLSSLTEIRSDNCGRHKKKILQDSLKWIKCLKIYLLVSSSLMNCGEFIRGHLKYKTFLAPVRNSLCWFIRSCIITHVPGFVSPKCDSSHIHNYLTWQAHSSFLDPLTSLVTEYISCLITSALFYIKNDYASTAELTRCEKKWKDVKKRFGCAERIFFHNKTVPGVSVCLLHTGSGDNFLKVYKSCSSLKRHCSSTVAAPVQQSSLSVCVLSASSTP